MELKVWVDGVLRVVCGLSEDTSCQDVVIALAQAIGQTGRYILIQKLRDTERQLLANEKPLESLAKCGQYANDVQFILRRTGPSAGERPSSNSDSSGTSVGVPLPAKPAEAPKRKEPKKSMTFNLGSMGSVDFSTKKKIKPAEPNGGEKNVSTVNGHVSKEEIFKKVLVQQEQLQALEAQIKSLESEIYSWEHPTTPSLEDELLILQQTIRSNNAELEEEELWVNELQIEKEQERTMQWKLKDLHSTLDECTRKLGDFDTKSALLEQEIQQENADRTKKSKQTSRSQAQVEDSLVRIKAELENKNKQHSMLDNSLKDMKKAVMEVESVLQVKKVELDELNKDLRQCNLQQFIQQTGSTVTVLYPRSEHEDLLYRIAEHTPDNHRNGDSSSPNLDFQFLGNPRNLQNPLVSSLNPEVLTTREATWR
ncbi:ras association domain-containing protein 8-like [Polypterus senegalus]|uniref:ras association domain-containing protein 8-like n=1 Tax=Polypterus senegalus TaxID=55291 RepID=UPI001963C458|nr:ras association domain-containing protein 8-like [Polypterus senegalus]